jgi:hypothetical protein
MLCCPTVRVPSKVDAENFSAGAPVSATPPIGRHKYPHRPSLSNPDSEANADSHLSRESDGGQQWWSSWVAAVIESSERIVDDLY